MAPTAWATLNKTSREAWPVRTFFKASDVKGKWDPPEITSPKRRKGTTRLKSRIKANINVQTRIKSIMCVFEKKSHQVWIEATYCCFCVILMFWLGFLALTWISNVFPNMLYETKQYSSGNESVGKSHIACLNSKDATYIFVEQLHLVSIDFKLKSNRENLCVQHIT